MFGEGIFFSDGEDESHGPGGDRLHFGRIVWDLPGYDSIEVAIDEALKQKAWNIAQTHAVDEETEQTQETYFIFLNLL